MEYSRMKPACAGERHVLYGYLELLAKLINLNYKTVQTTELGSQLVDVIIADFLFAIDKTPICDTVETKQVAFKVLLALISVSPVSFQSVLAHIDNLSKKAALHIKDHWNLQVLNDMRRVDISHSGLKNQGCTCYMNSLLQQLFMNVPFREAILQTPLLECHRTTSWHRSDEDFRGMDLLFEWQDGSMRKGRVLGYDSASDTHEVLYMQSDESVSFNIRQGRHHKETGRFRIIPSESIDPIKESEEHAYRVLEQLQRTFVFMKHSKRRYFDPRPFVEACKTLNLNFNVYQQNDAAEFYDQLLDRIEIATKGIHTKIDIWNEVILKRSFGAQTLYQKIPHGCEIYSTKKEECGHWQGTRVEPFLKLEVLIRGKENFFDSLDELVQNELMDGENKIDCDVCATKKTTNRSACINKLPNLMVLHLKRFELDFQTFETVKLNNKMEFPFDTHLNMFKYTKEGLEWEELNKQKLKEEEAGQSSPKPSNIQYESIAIPKPDMTDYEYELQGVLVHSGVAQGGHYYSFSRDPENNEKWYKLDDEDVEDI
jgi:ubiquitin carboxyl-terminal hydrolase 9/24